MLPLPMLAAAMPHYADIFSPCYNAAYFDVAARRFLLPFAAMPTPLRCRYAAAAMAFADVACVISLYKSYECRFDAAAASPPLFRCRHDALMALLMPRLL